MHVRILLIAIVVTVSLYSEQPNKNPQNPSKLPKPINAEPTNLRLLSNRLYPLRLQKKPLEMPKSERKNLPTIGILCI